MNPQNKLACLSLASFLRMTRGGGIVVEPLPRHSRVAGSSLVIAATRIEKRVLKCFFKYSYLCKKDKEPTPILHHRKVLHMGKLQGPKSKHFIFFVIFQWAH